MKKWIALLVLALAAGLTPPLINLAVDHTITMAPETLTGKTQSFKEASAIFQTSCLPCHSTKTQLPWYAQLPVAKQIISADMAEGLHHFNMEEALYTEGQAPSGMALAKILHVIQSGEMPPIRYTAMHWQAFLTPSKVAVLQQWIDDENTARNQTLGVADAFLTEPVSPIPNNVLAIGLTEPASAKTIMKIWLGNKLFHDTRLSGDGTLSCASCHGLQSGGVDGAKTSTGIHQQVGPINAPTVFNAVFNLKQFWDGRAADLTEQALGPVTNPIEMGGNWNDILPKLNADTEYRIAFSTLYGTSLLPDADGEGGSKKQISKEMVADAIAAFEASLITPNSPFDRYLRGDNTALTSEQIQGYEIFKSIGCTQCHAGVALGGLSFEKMGAHDNYFTARGGDLTDADKGRFNVTQAQADTHYFKVPTLRNIALTAPYFHDGSQADLSGAVKQMAFYQLGETLTDKETQAIVGFLQSLTGQYNGVTLSAQKPAQKSK